MRARAPWPVVLVVTALAAAGCEQDNVSVFIAGNVIPQPGERGCSLDPSAPLLTAPGTYNVDNATGGYRVYPLYQNQLRTNRSATGADPNGVHIQRAEIELLQRTADGLTPLEGLSGANPFSVDTSTFVPSTGGDQPGQAVGGFTAIPAAYRGDLSAMGARGTIMLAIRVFGETSGDVSIDTEKWTWPVELCGGDCLFTCTEGGGSDTQSCNPGQDFTTELECP